MKRLIIVIIALAIAAFAGWYYWNASQGISSASVSTLLPRDTILLAHMPDFNQTVDEWHDCDIYKLYREPAVQDFLSKPLGKVPKADAASQTLRDIEQLEPKHAFIALTSVQSNDPKFVAGFQFRGSEQDADRIISKWRSGLLQQVPSAKREKIEYQRHEIDVVTTAPFSLATTYARPWFFAATDPTELKAVLDRVDRRATDSATLDKEQAYREAVSHRPSNYAVFFYLQPKMFSQRLAALRTAVRSSPAPGETTMLERMRCIAGSMRFENGKIHDQFFLGMPKLERDVITRSSVSIGTKETVFFLSMLLNLGDKVDALNQASAFAGAKVLQALSESGITADDWKGAFGLELQSLGDWPSGAHWPSLLVTLPVTDTARAGRIVDALVRGDDATWTKTEKDGVRYFSKQSAASLVAITPTIALSSRTLIVGLNATSVEEAVKRSATKSSDFADSPTYKPAAKLLPEPTNFFAYIDMAMLYTRLDTSLRPMLLMAAAFMPSVAGSVDASKLPPAEIITKHLSPIVSSQRYDRDGYVAESVGPITLDQAAIGGAIVSSFGTAAAQKAGAGSSVLGIPSTTSPQGTSSPSPTP